MKAFFKNGLILLVFIVSFSFRSNAQKTITFDFKSKQKNDQALKSLEENDEVVVNVTNINRYLYDVDTKVETQAFFSSATAGLPATLPDNLKAILNLVNNARAIGGPSLLLDGTNAQYLAESGPQKVAIQKIFTDFEDYIGGKYSDFNTKYIDFVARNEVFYSKNVDPAKLHLLTWADGGGNWVDVNALKGIAVNDFQDGKNIIDNITPYIKYVKPIKKAEIDNFCKTFTAETYLKNLIDLYKSQLNVTAQDFEYTSPSTEVYGDKVNVTITFTPKESLKDSSFYKSLFLETYTFSYPIVKGFRVSFSAGFFSSRLTNHRYTLKDNYGFKPASGFDTTAYKSVISENNDKWALGANALMHVTYKFTKNWEAGIHLGLGTPLQTDYNINYLAGFSVLYGYKQRVGFNIGLAGGQIDVLSNSVNIDRKYDPATSSVATTKKFVADRLQISITYNLSDAFTSNSGK